MKKRRRRGTEETEDRGEEGGGGGGGEEEEEEEEEEVEGEEEEEETLTSSTTTVILFTLPGIDSVYKKEKKRKKRSKSQRVSSFHLRSCTPPFHNRLLFPLLVEIETFSGSAICSDSDLYSYYYLSRDRRRPSHGSTLTRSGDRFQRGVIISVWGRPSLRRHQGHYRGMEAARKKAHLPWK